MFRHPFLRLTILCVLSGTSALGVEAVSEPGSGVPEGCRAVPESDVDETTGSAKEVVHEKTGIEKKTVFNQTFMFIEHPGYAPSYSVGGMSIRKIQEKARGEGKDILSLNTYASSLGFPPMDAFEERLRKH